MNTQMSSGNNKILDALRISMFMHAFLDLTGAIILFFTPGLIQGLTPGIEVQPFTLRIIAGAFTAIAYASAKASNYDKPRTFIPLLQFKLVWSTVVWIGIIVSIVELKKENIHIPVLAWLTMAIFILGSILWNSFNFLLLRMVKKQGKQIIE